MTTKHGWDFMNLPIENDDFPWDFNGTEIGDFNGINGTYHLVNIQKAIEHGHRHS
jgi:hypothetical protein